jgi:TPR repeat protein
MIASAVRIASDIEWAPTIAYPGSLSARLHELPGVATSSAEDDIPDALPLGREPAGLAPEAQLQQLIRDFRRRQRQASVLVAGSLATACLLTIAGLMAAISFAKPSPADVAAPPSNHSTSLAWQQPQGDPAPLGQAASTMATNPDLEASPLLVPALAQSSDARPALLVDASMRERAAPTLILAAYGRPLALAPLLPRRQARYLLLRGLPSDAHLSAGDRNATGTWIVKNEDVAELTLLIGDATPAGTASADPANGDYPLDVYLLGGSDTPQARQSFILRIESEARASATLDTNWPGALLDLAMMSLPPEDRPVPAENSSLLTRAKELISEGDIAAARLLFLHLAERGQGEAAFELARSYDTGILGALGASGVMGDRTQALAWYQRAAGVGNEEATQRLKILASLSD